MPVLRGRVVSGVGNFSYWIARLEEHYTRKTGMQLFPGTLNVQLDSELTLPEKRMRLEVEEYGGTVSVNIVPCRIFDRHAFILRTDANEEGHGYHRRSLVEVACDVKLREVYGLADGDVVEIEV